MSHVFSLRTGLDLGRRGSAAPGDAPAAGALAIVLLGSADGKRDLSIAPRPMPGAIVDHTLGPGVGRINGGEAVGMAAASAGAAPWAQRPAAPVPRRALPAVRRPECDALRRDRAEDGRRLHGARPETGSPAVQESHCNGGDRHRRERSRRRRSSGSPPARLAGEARRRPSAARKGLLRSAGAICCGAKPG